MRPPDCFVLDALANDVESIDDVLRMLNSATALGWAEEWGRSFGRSDVVAALARLVRGGLVRAYAPTDDARLTPLAEGALPANLEATYFGMTERGKLAHTNWATSDVNVSDSMSGEELERGPQ